MSTGAAAEADTNWQPSAHELARRSERRRRTRRQLLIASLASIVFFAALGVGIANSPGWPRVQELFFNGEHARASWRLVLDGFKINVALFLLAQPLIMVLALAVALVRQTRSPWLLPLRIVAIVYTDLFRGIPTFLLIYLMGFGMPALGLQGVPDSRFFWALVTLVLSYGAYVAEVFRAGIESVHPSQLASAEALGLTRLQTMRYVVVPQAVRRVVPPLLNDFVSLQKDTALVSAIGVLDGVFAAQDYASYNFNYTSLVVVTLFFVALTIPTARLTDWLQARYAARERAR